jgi:hypothetical protein
MFVTEVTFDFYHCLSLAKNKNKGMEEVKCVCQKSWAGWIHHHAMGHDRHWPRCSICMGHSGRKVLNKFES